MWSLFLVLQYAAAHSRPATAPAMHPMAGLVFSCSGPVQGMSAGWRYKGQYLSS